MKILGLFPGLIILLQRVSINAMYRTSSLELSETCVNQADMIRIL